MPDYLSPSGPVHGASATTLQADHDCVPSGIDWVDELVGGWRRDRWTALVTYGYRVMYLRLVEQVARRFMDLGGEVDFVGSPLTCIPQPQPINLGGAELSQGATEIDRGDWPLVEVLRRAVPPTRIHCPGRVSDLRDMLPRVAGNTKRLIVVSAMDQLVANEGRQIMDPAEFRVVTRRLADDLQDVATDFSAALVVFAQHDRKEIRKRPWMRWLIRQTIFEETFTMGSFLFFVPNPLFLIGAYAYGGRYPGECNRVTLTPTDNGWEKYLRRGKQER